MTTRSTRRGKQAITIRDVAERLGVSAMTVSNALNGRGGMSDETRRGVLNAVATLGYVPNEAARALARAQTVKIGFVQPNHHNAFLSGVLVGALQTCRQLGAQLLLLSPSSRSLDAVCETVETLIASGANGILMAPPFAEMYEQSGRGIGAPVPFAAVSPGRPISGMLSVRVDDRKAAGALVDHLVQSGCSTIALIAGPLDHSSAGARAEGYRDALARNNLSFDPDLVVQGTFEFHSSADAIRKLLTRERLPDAIFASNDDMAAAALQIAIQSGIKVPEDLAIAGFDDAEIASRLWPTLTTIRLPVEEIARACTASLIRRVLGIEEVDDQLVEYELVERGSTGRVQSR